MLSYGQSCKVDSENRDIDFGGLVGLGGNVEIRLIVTGILRWHNSH